MRNKEDNKDFLKFTECWICDNHYVKYWICDNYDVKVRDLCYITGNLLANLHILGWVF